MDHPLALLGLARKAGRIVLGGDAVGQRLRQGKAPLLLFASDAAPNAVHRAKQRAETAKTEFLTIPYTKEQFGRALGRQTCALALLTDEGFAAAFRKQLKAEI